MAVGDPNLFFSRDTRVFLKQGVNIWEIPVLNGYSFTQTTNSSTITVAEMSNCAGGGTSRRGQRVFNDSLSPAEWSFDVYLRPTLSTGTMFAVEEALWANMAAVNAYTAGSTSWAAGVTRTAAAGGNPATLDFDFDDSNSTLLGTFELFFVLGGSKVAGLNYTASEQTTIYQVTECVVNEATINFEIDGIAMVSWAGLGKQIIELATFDATGAIRAGIDSNSNMIRNRLTCLDLTTAGTGGFSANYDLTLTGGSITISNNITFVTPETIGIVNVPLGHITGTRSVSGNFTCYLDEKTNSSIDLMEDLLLATNVVTNSFGAKFYLGGKASTDYPTGPGVLFDMPNCHLEIPSINADDIIAVEVNFTALPTTIGDADEIAKIRYVGV
jgi:hypothetical protein